MRRLNKPIYTAKEVFITCISNISDSDLKERYEECIPEIVKASDNYELLAKSALLHTFKDNLCTVKRVNIKEMKAVYVQKMANSKGPGYNIYNKIKKNTFNRTCPLCGQRKVTTLDHFLPKAYFPSFVVAPVNLIPACSDCNKGKSSKIPKSSDEETLHPYFDDLGTERFLFANVIDKTSSPVINFYVNSPASWSVKTATRVNYHFESYKLNLLYRSHTIDEMFGQAGNWNRLNKNSLKGHLNEQAESWKCSNINSWQTAFYESMANSDWFCNGGYHEIMEQVEKEDFQCIRS